MKEIELRKHATCSVCHQPIGHTGLPLFWIVKIERHGINMREVDRQDGLAAYLGNSYLAHVMGSDPEMTMPVMEPVELTLCETCAMPHIDAEHIHTLSIAELAEMGVTDEDYPTSRD